MTVDVRHSRYTAIVVNHLGSFSSAVSDANDNQVDEGESLIDI